MLAVVIRAVNSITPHADDLLVTRSIAGAGRQMRVGINVFTDSLQPTLPHRNREAVFRLER